MIKDFITYLGFDGNCEEAFRFYEKALGGEITGIFYYKDAPGGNQHPDNSDNRVMHVTLQVGGKLIQGGDAPTGQFSGHSGYCINISLDDSTEAETVFNALADGGNITMPVAETFWAHRFGMLTDKFGVPWMVNHQKPTN